jgi:hypothetical protein
VVLYLGIRYENFLSTHLKARGSSLGERIKSAGRAIPDDLPLALMDFNRIRNTCAHSMGIIKLQNLHELIALVNQIEDGFSSIVPDWKPDYISQNDFAHIPESFDNVHVSLPSRKDVYRQEIVVPRIIKIGLSALAVALLLLIVFGTTSQHTNDYNTGGFIGIGSVDHQDTYNDPTGAFWLVIVAAFIAVGGWAWYSLPKKWKAKWSRILNQAIGFIRRRIRLFPPTEKH